MLRSLALRSIPIIIVGTAHSEELNLESAKKAIEIHHQAEVRSQSSWGILDRELSSDVAGETGAVYIYRGAQSALRLRGIAEDAQVFKFVRSHEAAEETHLAMMKELIEPQMHTSLLPIWRCAGFALGFLPTLLAGPYGLFATVESVEEFVVEHYEAQLKHLSNVSHRCPDQTADLKRVLSFCCADEKAHMLDARRQRQDLANSSSPISSFSSTSPNHEDRGEVNSYETPSFLLSTWDFIVKAGSRIAAEAARRI